MLSFLLPIPPRKSKNQKIQFLQSRNNSGRSPVVKKTNHLSVFHVCLTLFLHHTDKSAYVPIFCVLFAIFSLIFQKFFTRSKFSEWFVFIFVWFSLCFWFVAFVTFLFFYMSMVLLENLKSNFWSGQFLLTKHFDLIKRLWECWKLKIR